MQAYAAAFRNVVLELDTAAPNDGDLLFRFIEGLNDDVRREVYMERPTLLADAIALAERADSALFHSQRGGKRVARRDQSEPMDWSYGLQRMLLVVNRVAKVASARDRWCVGIAGSKAMSSGSVRNHQKTEWGLVRGARGVAF